MSKDGQGKWIDEMAAIGEELERWEGEHPDATMREIELRVEQAMAQLGAQVMAELAVTRERRDDGEAVCCPKCGV
jgi:hypothetical protein